MERNANEIVKELEGLANFITCPTFIKDALDLIYAQGQRLEVYRQSLAEVRVALAEANNDKKKLTEENERLRNLFGKDVLDIVDYAVDKNRLVKADTVQKMYAEIKRRCIEGGIYPAFVASVIEQVVKEITDETGE